MALKTLLLAFAASAVAFGAVTPQIHLEKTDRGSPRPVSVSQEVVEGAETKADLESRKGAAGWNCDIRCWVRAPDLRPDGIFPAEARLKFNGSDCGELQSWSVGLKLKERAIVRVRSKIAVELVTAPETNISTSPAGPVENDYNDIYNIQTFDRDSDKRLSDRSLWDVHGVERVVFDAKVKVRDLRSLDDALKYDATLPFNVHVPNTNLPPLPGGGGTFSMSEENDGFASAESSFSYYFALQLQNGSIIESPAGRTAFIPETYLAHREMGRPETVERKVSFEWRQTMGLWNGAKVENSTVPFDVTVSMPADGVLVQGERLALNFTVSRNPAAKGVYASRLMLRQIISIYETWASTFAHSPEVAHKLAHADSTHLRHGVMFTEAMERTATVEHLEAVQQSERERQWREIERGCGAELWLRDGDEDGPHTDMTSDAEGVQHVTVNASVSNYRLPAFETTFRTFGSRLRIRLRVRSVNPDSADVGDDDDGDPEWDPAWAPYIHNECKRWPRRPEEYTDYIGYLNMTVVTPVADRDRRPTHLQAPTHYTSAAAKAPVLLLPTDPVPTAFPSVDTTVRDETDASELRRMRYHVGSGKPWRKSDWGWDGDGLLVGEVWQSNEERRKKADRKRPKRELLKLGV